MRRLPFGGGYLLVASDGVGKIDVAGHELEPGLEGRGIVLTGTRREAEDLALAILNEAGWDTAAMLAGPGGRAPVYVGEIVERSPRKVTA